MSENSSSVKLTTSDNSNANAVPLDCSKAAIGVWLVKVYVHPFYLVDSSLNFKQVEDKLYKII